ncbi:YncE family protein [Streptomyces sp. NPDC058572]|uniref:YncE family protein n=1 Tax=Streptomyces sp. NPDC058572 TaxID=3346546 RepID=UPI0036663A0A
MRKRTLPAATALAVLFSSVALVAGAAGPAAADSAKILPVKSAGDVVVDGVHQRVYVSDPAGGKIVVTDYAGTVVATLADLPGVNGLEISADSGQVYAAVAGSGRIVSVETGTYTQSASYDLGAQGARDLAVAGGRVWFGYAQDGIGHIGSLDLSGAEPVVALAQDGGQFWTGTPLLGADPAAPGVLAVSQEGGSSVAVYDVASGSATLRVSKDVGAGNMREVDVTPDGQRVITASGAPYRHPAYSTTDLSEVASHTTDAYPNAVAIAPDGTLAAGIDGWYQPDVYVFPQGSTKAVRTYDFPNTGNTSGADTLEPGALAWSPDSSRLFAVSRNSAGVLTLRTFADPTKSVPALTVTAPASAARAKALTVTGKLTASEPLPAGTPLTVTRTDMESPTGKSLGTRTLKDDGTFSFSDTPPAGGKVTYKVSYAGDATHTAASASAVVNVSRATPTLTLNNNGKVYSHGQDVAFAAHLGTTYKNRSVEIWADPFGADKPKKLVKTGTVNSSGNLWVTLDMSRDTTLTAVFKGDARYAPKTVKATAYAKVKISQSLSRHYRTGKIGSTTYHYFHKNTHVISTTTMSYHKGRKQRLQLQVYFDGKWYDGNSEYFTLGTNGKSVVDLGAAGDSGIRARIRASYVNGSSGDTVNSTTHGAWKYIYFSN